MNERGQSSRPRTPTTIPTQSDRTTHTDEALKLLSAGVPLSLLLDLATAPDSHQVYDREPGDVDWLPVAVAAC
jgi:hypothetical protein